MADIQLIYHNVYLIYGGKRRFVHLTVSKIMVHISAKILPSTTMLAFQRYLPKFYHLLQ